MSGKKTVLACSICGSRNYTKTTSRGKDQQRLTANKFCRYCNKHTLHKETK